MTFSKQVREFDASLREAFPPVCRWIVYLSTALYLISFLAPPIANMLLRWFACIPSRTLLHGHLWQLLTYGLLHGGLWHLAVNLLGLYFFGTRIEWRWGSDRFLRFAVIATVFSALTHSLGSYALVFLGAAEYILYVPMVGASGLVFAVMMLAACHDPDSPVYVFPFPVAIKLKYYVGIIGLLTLLAIPQAGGIAHLAHLGGLIIGYLFYRRPDLLDKVPIPSIGGNRRGPRGYQTSKGNWRRR